MVLGAPTDPDDDRQPRRLVAQSRNVVLLEARDWPAGVTLAAPPVPDRLPCLARLRQQPTHDVLINHLTFKKQSSLHLRCSSQPRSISAIHGIMVCIIGPSYRAYLGSGPLSNQRSANKLEAPSRRRLPTCMNTCSSPGPLPSTAEAVPPNKVLVDECATYSSIHVSTEVSSTL